MSGPKIYTRTGDKGETSLYSGQRVQKDSEHIEAIGDVDEINCMLGAAVASLPHVNSFSALREQLESIQHALFDVGAALATPLGGATERQVDKTRFGGEATKALELWIDEMNTLLPPLKFFILPGGSQAGAFLHNARSICRRAERHVTPLFRQGDVDECPLIYLNRLSDYLFVAARHANQLCEQPETRWEHHKVAP